MHLSDTKFPNVNSQMEAWKYSKVESFLRLSHNEHEPEDVSGLGELPEEIQNLFKEDKNTRLIIFYNGQAVSGSGALNLTIDSDNFEKFNFLFLYGNRLHGETRASRINIENAITVKGKSKLTIFEAHIALNDIEFSLLQNTRLKLSGDSNVERVKCFWLGDESYAYDLEKVELSEGASCKNLLIQMGGKWSRIEQDAALVSAGTNYQSLGAYLLAGSGHCDLTTNIDHVVGHTNSEQLFKGLVAESSRSAFTGKILIRKDAQKSATAQLNQNIVLGERAEADSRPTLEVYADDVTASHGTTVGGLNEDEIFYLQSRGLSKSQATEMVAKAFVQDLSERLDDQDLKRKTSSILEKGFSRYVQSSLGGL